MSGIVNLPVPAIALGQGQSDASVLGTKTSGPTGIESPLEYNGIYLNVRSWIDTYLIETINGFDDADIRDNREPNPGRHGETSFTALYGGRTIVLQGKIQARTIWKLRDMQKALRAAFADLSVERPLIMHTGNIANDMQIYCKKSQPIQMADEQQTANYFERAFQITLRASNPRFTSLVEHYTPFVPVVAAGAVAAQSFALNNAGNFLAQPVIRIYGEAHAGANGARSVTLTNSATKDNIFINAKANSTVAIPATSYIEIDIAKRTMKEYAIANDALVGNAFDRLDVSSDWLHLAPGPDPNNITVSYTATTGGGPPQITFRYRDTVM